MKASIGLLLLFLVTEQVVCENAGNSTASNDTISSTTAKPFYRKIIDAFKGASSTDKKNDSALTTSTESSAYNTTKEQPATNSSTGTTATIGTSKSSTVAYNTTKGNASTANVEGDEENKTTSTLYENTEKDRSTSKVLQGYSAGNSASSERALVTTKASDERDLPKVGENASNPSTDDADLTNTDSSLPKEFESDIPEPKRDDNTGSVSFKTADDDFASPEHQTDEEDLMADDSASFEEVESTALEHQANNDTEGAALDDIDNPRQHEKYCTDYISKLLLETLTKHANQLDPLLLRDRKMSFEAPFLLSSVEGQLGLYDGKMTGISRGKPSDECKVEMTGDQVRLVSGIYIDEALINYKGRATFMEFGPKLTIDGKLSGITADLSVIVPEDGGIGRIEAFRVRRIKRTKVDIKGLGILDWAVEVISEDAARLYTFVFRRSIERDLRKALEDEITKIAYP